MIRTIALGVACLAGLGAIAAAAKKLPPVPAPEIVIPVVAGNKADRLPLAINQDTPTAAERVDVVYVQPSGQGQVQPTEQGQAGLSAPDFAPDNFEVDFKGRFTRADLSPLGLRVMGY